MKRPPAHVLNAFKLRNEVAALVASRLQNGKELPAPAGIAYILAHLAVVLDRDGPTVPGVQRIARALGAGELPPGLVLPEVRRAASTAKLGREWRLPSADTIGLLLRVSEVERSRLGLRLVGSQDLPACERRRAAERARKARTREAAGATPRHEALSSTKPWEAAGVSRATYFRKQKMNETNSSAPLSVKYKRADETVSPTPANGEAPALVAPTTAHLRRPFEPAPPAPPILPGSIRDRARRSAILPHPRVLAALKAAAGPIDIADLARVADLRRDACRRATSDLVAGGLLHRTGRDEVVLSASITALSNAAASPNEYR